MTARAKIEIVSYEALYTKLEESGVFEGTFGNKIAGKVLGKASMIDKKYLDKIVCFGIKVANRRICNGCQKFLDDNCISVRLNLLKADVEEGIMDIQAGIEVYYKDLVMDWKDSVIPEELKEWYDEWGEVVDKLIEILFTELPKEACDQMVALLVNNMLHDRIVEKIQEVLEVQGLEMHINSLHIE